MIRRITLIHLLILTAGCSVERAMVPTTGNELVLRQDLIVTKLGDEQILYTYWPDGGLYCPWYKDFDRALAANPFPTPFNDIDWPVTDCKRAP